MTSHRHCMHSCGEVYTYHCCECAHHTDECPEVINDACMPCWLLPCPDPDCALKAGHTELHRCERKTEAGIVWRDEWETILMCSRVSVKEQR